MITLVEFCIYSVLSWIMIVYLLLKINKKNNSLPILANKGLFVLLTVFFVGGYGIIFKGGNLIEDLYLVRSSTLQLVSLFFALLYGITFIKIIKH